jgi:hypothetical protein
MTALMGIGDEVQLLAGIPAPLSCMDEIDRQPGVDVIIAEAKRENTELPLYIAVGGGLTEVAAALKVEPSIADRMTVIWIGGGSAHPDGARYEPNFGIDRVAARYVFNETSVPIWHVPSEVYQTCVTSTSEILAHVATSGPIGAWLADRLVATADSYRDHFNPGETWSLGDSPLVVLTALRDWVPSARLSERGPYEYERTGSSRYELVSAPYLDPEGIALPRGSGRKIRRYVSIDTRLMINDFYAKLQLNYG